MVSEIVVVGSYVQDHCWKTSTFPAIGESRIGTFSTGAGGKGFNQAIAAHRQGVKTVFLGALGQDALAETAKRFAADDGLDAHWEIRPDAATAASSIVVNAHGDNLICVALGANEKLSPEFIRANAQLISQAKVLVCQLENNLQAGREAMRIARSAGVLTILNPAPINDRVDLTLLQLADIITPNETEFAFLMQHVYGKTLAPNYCELNDKTLHSLCRETGIKSVVITLGDKGCFVSHDPLHPLGDQENFYRLPPEVVKVIDTTGAGDAFNGGLAAGTVKFRGAAFKRSVQHANRVAALSVEKPGTAPAMPSFAEVLARFAEC